MGHYIMEKQQILKMRNHLVTIFVFLGLLVLYFFLAYVEHVLPPLTTKELLMAARPPTVDVPISLINGEMGQQIVITHMPTLIAVQVCEAGKDKAEQENRQRLQRISRVCSTYVLGSYKSSGSKSTKNQLYYNIKHPPTPQYSVFYIDKKDKIAYCPLYKAASTTWLHNLCLLGGYTEEQLKTSKEQLSTLARRIYPEMDYPYAKKAMDKSLKILVVRHPFERLLSAYRDKLENRNLNQEDGSAYYYNKYGSKIVAKYRKTGASLKKLLLPGTYYWDPAKPKPTGKEPTFKEFVRYLLGKDLLNYADDHWIPYYLYCTPCLVKYDYIAKVETLDRDQTMIIEKAGLASRIFPRWEHKYSPSSTYLSRLYYSQLSRKEIQSLYKKYRLDFELFEYSINPYLEYGEG